ncbi:MAG: radical SAM protein [Proteobacteria bacterium]|nr:radical SAM protein [Pseudomonadota bacterium]
MQYVGNVIRPPSEADSIILQVTVGCSYNKCTFCGAYKDVSFTIKDEAEIKQDLRFARQHCRNQKRVFLADGDVLILSQKRLVRLFQLVHEYLPWISRISLYGNARAIRGKSKDILLELKALGLDRIYMGLESGCDEILQRIEKGETAESMIAAGRKIRGVGIFLSVTALLGLGGIALSKRHAEKTAKVLTAMAPSQIAMLTLIPLKNTVLGQEIQAGKFLLPNPQEILAELSLLIRHLQNVRCQFHANHASSYLPIFGRLPKDQVDLLASIEMAKSGASPLVAEHRRAL